MTRPFIVFSIATGALALLTLGACGSQPDPSGNTVVTSRSNGQAIPNPRGGSYKKSEPGTYEYTSPTDNTTAPAKTN